jgi:hypothetical protein
MGVFYLPIAKNLVASLECCNFVTHALHYPTVEIVKKNLDICEVCI